jgi:plasmid stabilization system protein ParE
MNIRYEEQFKNALLSISSYIAKDKPSASYDFKRALKSKIEDIPHNPKMYRKSYYFDDENYRDLTFKGYTIVYKIEQGKNYISILDIFKWVKK